VPGSTYKHFLRTSTSGDPPLDASLSEVGEIGVLGLAGAVGYGRRSARLKVSDDTQNLPLVRSFALFFFFSAGSFLFLNPGVLPPPPTPYPIFLIISCCVFS